MLRKAHVVPFPAEHAVMNTNNRKIVACPTEQEANEYIKMMEEAENHENIDSERESL
jgi:hypothetical protein